MDRSILLREGLVPTVVLLAALLVLAAVFVWASGATPLRTLQRAVAPGLHITRPGCCWLILTLLLLGIGWLKALNLILLLGYLLLGVWITNALLAGRGLRTIRAERRLPGAVFAGTPFVQHIQVETRGAAAVLGVRIEDRGPDHDRQWFVPRLQPGAPVAWDETLEIAQRCLYACPPLRAVSGYPFGLVQRSVPVSPGQDVVVLPQLGRLDAERLRRFLAQATAIEGTVYRQARAQLQTPTELHGLRPYRPGESPRWIHWRTTARRGALMVREFSEATGDDLILIVDPWLPAGPLELPPSAPRPRPEEAALEAALSLAATICWEWCRQPEQHFTLAVAGRAPLVVSGSTGRAQALYLLERLAAVGGCAASCPERLIAALDRARLPAAPVLVVGSRPSELTAALSGFFQRPVAAVAAADLEHLDFYERPSHAT